MTGLFKRIFLVAAMCLLTMPFIAAAIVYLPPTGASMWDSWLFCEGKDCHLFYLRSEPGQRWNSIGHAVSQDLVHWRELAAIPTQGAEGAWDHTLTLTGCTVKHGDVYYLFYGSANKAQQIGIMTSRDLLSWQKHPGNPILVSGPPNYGDGFDWRDLYAFFDPVKKVWHGLVCARAGSQWSQPCPRPNLPRHAGHGEPCIGHLVSPDLIHWEQRPPLFASWTWGNLEVPEHFEMGNKHYLLFSHGGSMPATSGRKHAGGTFYLMADKMEGPYQAPSEPLLLGWGRNRLDNYVGRTIVRGGERLLYHHTVGGPVTNDSLCAWQPGKGGPVTWGSPKRVQQRTDGTLWLEYWPGLDRLERSVLMDGKPQATSMTNDKDSVLWLPVTAKDSMITCLFTPGKETQSVGIAWRWNGTRSGAVLLYPGENKLVIGEVRIATDGARQVEVMDEYDRVKPSAGERQLRVLVRGLRAEVYLDDQWIFATPTVEGSATGRIGLLVCGDGTSITNVRVAELEPLVPSENSR